MLATAEKTSSIQPGIFFLACHNQGWQDVENKGGVEDETLLGYYSIGGGSRFWSSVFSFLIYSSFVSIPHKGT
jgi:hypothetical protein